ncbi:hypothetical protein [Halobacteriovorax sp. HLS]|uniref:hypothetical protein n=1 Tax=Halobacteriovorax sp. HLS TaxID=2234000 RepID=UPI000FD7CDDB|nr:hypothetical protein [Halobacteriovorax sp. HLS]
MYFGSYLFKNKHLSFKDYISCLSAQIKSTPSLLECLVSEDLLPEEKIVDLVNIQFNTKRSLRDLLINENFITQDQLSSLMNKLTQSQKSFSELLIENGLLKKEEIETLLKEYEKTAVNDEYSAQAGTKSEASTEEVEINSAALESLKELEGVDLSDFNIVPKEKVSDESSCNDEGLSLAALESLRELDPEAAGKLEIKYDEKEKVAQSPNDTFVNEFAETFNEKMFRKMKKIVVVIFKTAKEDGDFSNFFNSLFREFHLVKGAARLAGFKLVEDVLDQWEDCLDSFFKLSDQDQKNWLNAYGEKINDLIDASWSIRESLVSGENESEIDLSKIRGLVDLFSGERLAS